MWNFFHKLCFKSGLLFTATLIMAKDMKIGKNQNTNHCLTLCFSSLWNHQWFYMSKTINICILLFWRPKKNWWLFFQEQERLCKVQTNVRMKLLFNKYYFQALKISSLIFRWCQEKQRISKPRKKFLYMMDFYIDTTAYAKQLRNGLGFSLIINSHDVGVALRDHKVLNLF